MCHSGLRHARESPLVASVVAVDVTATADITDKSTLPPAAAG